MFVQSLAGAINASVLLARPEQHYIRCYLLALPVQASLTTALQRPIYVPFRERHQRRRKAFYSAQPLGASRSHMSSVLSTAVAMPDDPAPGAVQLLVQVGDTHPELLRLVINRMQEGGAACMRMVNRALCQAVNRTVTTVACTVSRGPPLIAMDKTFPNADRLRLVLPPFGTAAHDDAASHLLWFGQGMWHSSPGLLRKITALQIFIATDLSPSSGTVEGCLLHLVSKYAVRKPLLLAFASRASACQAAVIWCRVILVLLAVIPVPLLAHGIAASLGIPTSACVCH
jgi:hypothetical protein